MSTPAPVPVLTTHIAPHGCSPCLHTSGDRVLTTLGDSTCTWGNYAQSRGPSDIRLVPLRLS